MSKTGTTVERSLAMASLRCSGRCAERLRLVPSQGRCCREVPERRSPGEPIVAVRTRTWLVWFVWFFTIVGSLASMGFGWLIESDFANRGDDVDVVAYTWGGQLGWSLLGACTAGVAWGMYAGRRHLETGARLGATPAVAWLVAVLGLASGGGIYAYQIGDEPALAVLVAGLPYFALVTALPATLASAFTYFWWYIGSPPRSPAGG